MAGQHTCAKMATCLQPSDMSPCCVLDKRPNCYAIWSVNTKRYQNTLKIYTLKRKMWAASLLPIFCKQTYLMVLSGKSYCFSAALPRQQAVWLQWPQYLLEEAISFDLNRFTEIVSQSASIWLPSPLEFEQNRCELKQTCRRLWACYGAKQGLWFHPLWVSVTWMMTLFSVQFESTKLHGHFEHFRSRSSPVHRATSPGSGTIALRNWKIQPSMMFIN